MTRTNQPVRMPRHVPANNNTPPTLLTLDRAIDDGLPPEQLRMVAAWQPRGKRGETIATNLQDIADRLLALGYGERRAA